MDKPNFSSILRILFLNQSLAKAYAFHLLNLFPKKSVSLFLILNYLLLLKKQVTEETQTRWYMYLWLGLPPILVGTDHHSNSIRTILIKFHFSPVYIQSVFYTETELRFRTQNQAKHCWRNGVLEHIILTKSCMI